MNIELFTAGYIAAALWSSTGDDGEPLDSAFSRGDLAPECLAGMRSSCADFAAANARDLAEYCKTRGADSAGHDFWLTRCGHGAGFWDRGLGALGNRLSDAAKIYGGVDLYVGDGGRIHGETE